MDLKYVWIIVCFIVFLIIAAVVNTRMQEAEQNYQTAIIARSSSLPPTETIFVSVPNYRDSETPQTLYDLFSKAYAPHRIFVGLCNQTKNVSNERDVLNQTIAIANSPVHAQTRFSKNFNYFFQKNVRVDWIDHTLARGPTIARAAIEKRLYANEKYYMMIDSHMRFAPGWDEKLLEMLHSCPSDKPILTMVPDRYHRETTHAAAASAHFDENVPPLCSHVVQYDQSGFPVVHGRPFAMLPSRPMKQLFWSSCFSFTFAAAHKEVPYDPHARNLFFGEQMAMSARLWTSGWDFFAPLFMICKHLYDTDYRPTFWELRKSPDDAVKRVQCLLNMRPRETVHTNITNNLDRFALGSERNLTDYEEFADVNLKAQTFGKRACAGLSPNASNDECLAKFGSFADMRHLMQGQRR